MNIEQKWIIIAGEEAGPKSNKMGGIWNVIDAESHTLASMIDSNDLEEDESPGILVAGPYYGHSGADWNKGLNRITDVSGFEEMEPEDEIKEAIESLQEYGIEVITAEKRVKNSKVGYLLFKTDNFCRINTVYNGTEMSLDNKIKAEAFDLIGLDSLKYESLSNGQEYTHYLNLSYAISEFVRIFVNIKEKYSKEYHDRAIAEFAASLMPTMNISLHCHEFGLFYTIARLKKIGITVNTVATLHATLPGRGAGYRSIQKIRDNDTTWIEGIPENTATLESLSKYADVVTAVGDSTRKEIKLFYGITSIVVRNGIYLDEKDIKWTDKIRLQENIQNFLSETIYRYMDGKQIPYKKIIPIFSISRIEIENKGYPDLLDSLVLLDRIIKIGVRTGRIDEDIRIVCFVVCAHGPKSNLPDGFPINMQKEILVGEENRLQKMIEERGLQCSSIPGGTRHVSAILYPQWLSENDGGLNMNTSDFMTGCIAGIFPSRYEPFLLTGLEAGKEYTPSIVSKICGFSDALDTIESLVPGIGGVIVVDNIDISYNETIIDYALSINYLVTTYMEDKVKYKLLCQEANLLARKMNWEGPVKEYYELLMGTKIK